jgi:hypothetical protein
MIDVTLTDEDLRGLAIARTVCWVVVTNRQTALPRQVADAGDRLDALIKRAYALRATRQPKDAR